MKKVIELMATALCMLVAGGGCALEDSAPEVPEVIEGAFQRSTIIMTNGATLNGPLLNGNALAGSEVYGKTVAGTSAAGSVLRGITLQDSGLKSVRVSDGAVVSGTALVGATFATQMPDGSPMNLRIGARSSIPSQHHAGSIVNHYELSYRQSGSNAWKPVCGELNGVPVLAIPLAGRWNYAQGVPGGGEKLDEPDWITFACSGFTLEKCVTLGYEPWTKAGGERLDGYHQACVRAHRADYCGDGRSYTEDGHLINIFDKLGIQDDTESWSLESEWDTNGARCLSRQRIEGGHAPDCASELPRCDTPPDWGTTLVVTEAP
jgi:hypothetical protein